MKEGAVRIEVYVPPFVKGSVVKGTAGKGPSRTAFVRLPVHDLAMVTFLSSVTIQYLQYDTVSTVLKAYLVTVGVSRGGILVCRGSVLIRREGMIVSRGDILERTLGDGTLAGWL